MYKLVSNTGYIMNSYNIYELWGFIVSNNMTYTISKDYIPVSNDDFLSIFLKQTKNWKAYHQMYLKFNPTITINKYLWHL